MKLSITCPLAYQISFNHSKRLRAGHLYLHRPPHNVCLAPLWLKPRTMLMQKDLAMPGYNRITQLPLTTPKKHYLCLMTLVCITRLTQTLYSMSFITVKGHINSFWLRKSLKNKVGDFISNTRHGSNDTKSLKQLLRNMNKAHIVSSTMKAHGEHLKWTSRIKPNIVSG
jgi:hypothetical protein